MPKKQQISSPTAKQAPVDHTTAPDNERATSNAAVQDAMKKSMGGGTHVITKGETLWGIATQAYGNGALWEEIQKANPDKVHRGGDLIYTGQVLELPVITDDKATGAKGGRTPAVGPQLRTTKFGVFSVYPDDFKGPLPLTQDGIQVVKQSTFAQYEQEAATQVINPDIDALADNVSFDRTVVTIGTERVAVTSKAEAFHAQRIIKTIREDYGIKVDSSAGVDAIKAQYTRVPQTELDKLKTKEWEYKELAALGRALAHFAPLLGDKRKTSSRKAVDQEVTSVGKVDQAINRNRATGQLDTTTLGEYFAGSKNFSMFSAGTNADVDFSDSDKQLEGTAVHELTHALMKSQLPAFVAAMDYWTDQYTASGKATAEDPPTNYGQTNAAEDLSESMMYFFVDPSTLKSGSPKRYAWIETAVKSWKPAATPKAATPKAATP